MRWPARGDLGGRLRTLALVSWRTPLQLHYPVHSSIIKPEADVARISLHICSVSHLHLHLGLLADAFFQSALHKKALVIKKEKQQHITVGSLRMFKETSAKHSQVNQNNDS